MPWATKITLDTDKTTTGAEVGLVVGTYTDGSMYATEPFVTSMRSQVKNSALAAVKTAFTAALTAETDKRTKEAERQVALDTVLNT